ncbi:MAG TPA: hypothetical protein VHS57_07185 [Acidimicrobiales bacterium]|nr:hypothetical protein [Acidimicrobiales bacterium]
MIILAVLVAVILSGCSPQARPNTSSAARVLGEPKETTLVVGQPAPSETSDLGAVSCATAKRCWAVGTAGPDTTPPPGGAAVIARTTDGGVSWKSQHVSGGSTPDLSGISCPNSTDCMAVGSNGSSLPGGGVVVVTGDAGAVWKTAPAPAGALTVATVFCSILANCVAIVSDGTLLWSAVTSNFGATWQQLGDLPSSFLAGDDLSCTAGGTCLVAGYVPTSSGQGQGAVALSTDDGHTWALATVPSGTGILQSATCPSASVCLAGGTESMTVSDIVPAQGELLQSADGGHTWTDVTPAPPVDDIYGMQCASAQVCAMVGTKWVGHPSVGTGAVAQSADGGATFKTSSAAYIPITLTALSCPTPSGCVAVGGDTVARLTLVTASPPPRHSHG